MKTFGKIILLLIVALIGTLTFLNYKYSKPVAYDDSDLIFTAQDVPSSQNGFNILLPTLKEIQMIKSFDSLRDEVKELSIQENDFNPIRAEEILQNHSNSLNQLANALQVNYFHIPYQESFLEEEKIDSFTKELAFISYLELVNARMLLHDKSFDQAGYSLEKLMRLSYLLQQSENTILGYMLGAVIKGKTISLINQFVEESEFGSQYYINYISRIEKYFDKKGMDIAFKIEYTGIANTIRQLFSDAVKKSPELQEKYKDLAKGQGKWGGLFYNESLTLKKISDYFRQLVKNTSLPFSEITEIDITRDYRRGADRWFRYYSGNAVGKVLIDMMMPNFAGRVQQVIIIDTRTELIKTYLAVKAFHMDKQQIPKSLNELVPGYLKSIPKDAIGDSILKLSQDGKVIYSVGKDMNDDGGDKEKDLTLELKL